MKQFATAMLAAAFVSSAFAADYTVTPAQGYQAQIEKQVVIGFNDAVTLGTGDPSVSYNIGGAKETLNCTNGIELQAEGNNLKIVFTRGNDWTLKPGLAKPFKSMSGVGYNAIGDPSEMEFTVPAGAYNVGGVEGEELKIKYILTTNIPEEVSFDYTVEPAIGWLKDPTQIFTLTFEGEVAANVTDTDIASVDCIIGGASQHYSGGSYLTTTYDGKKMIITAKKAIEIGAKQVFNKFQYTGIEAGPLTFTIAEGSYTVNGEAGPAIKLEYVLSETDPDTPEPAMTITPAAESRNADIKEVVINFGGSKVASWVAASLSNTAIYWNSEVNGKYTGFGSKAVLSNREGSLVITMPNGGLAPGKYEFEINGSNYTVDGAKGETLTFNIYVDAPNLDNAQDFEYTLTPSTTSIQKTLKELRFTLPGEVVLANPFNGNCQYSFDSAEAAANPTNGNWFANNWLFDGCYAEGNTLVLSNSGTNGLNIPEGKNQVYLYIPGGTFMVDGVYNKGIALKYYVEAPEFFDYTVTPKNKSTLEKLETVKLDYFDVDTNQMTFKVAPETNITVSRNGVALEDVTVKATTEDNVLNLTFEPAQDMPGTYGIVIPAGTVLIDGLGCPETSLSYSIDYATADFKANPVNGTTMVKFQKVTLTFDEGIEIGVAPEANYALLNSGKWDATYTAEGNVLTVELARAREEVEDAEGNVSYKGEFTFEIKEGLYTINGIPGATISLNYIIDKTADDKYKPKAPQDVKYETCFVQTRVLRDLDGNRVTSVGNDGEVQVIAKRGGKIHCTITNETLGGSTIPNARLDYRILVRHKGEETGTPLIFSAENGYIKWEQQPEELQPMEWLPNNFTDAYDVTVSLGGEDGPNYHVIYFYENPETIAEIGVQSRWERSGTVFESNIAWVEPTTPDLTGALTWEEWEELERRYQNGIQDIVISESAEYLNLQGIPVGDDYHGIVICKTKKADGTTKISKIIR